MAQTVTRLSAMLETRVGFLGWEDPLEKEMATHSSILAWRIPWTEVPGRVQSRGCKSHNLATNPHLIEIITLFIHYFSDFTEYFMEVFKILC